MSEFNQRIAALAEILLVLAVGNLLGSVLFGLIAPGSFDPTTPGDPANAFYSGLSILLRLGTAAALGLGLLYFRRGITPAQAGLGKAGRPLGELLHQGLVAGVVAGFLVSLMFAVHALVPFGQGLDAWWTFPGTTIDGAFWVYMLGTSVLIPPLTEEILARGYFRVRLVEGFGPMSGVILAALVFGVAHTRYITGDPMLLVFMAIILINSLIWTFLVQKTGSIIPAFVAHALSNAIGTAVLFNIWIPLAGTLLGVVMFWPPIVSLIRDFIRACRNDRRLSSLWHGVIIIGLGLAATLVLANLVGRTATLATLAVLSFAVTALGLYSERNS